MSKKYNYNIGEVYGCQKLISIDKIDHQTTASVECVYCHRIKRVRPNYLLHSRLNSCRCRECRIPGGHKTRLYHLYHNMLYRCNTPTSTCYPRYGAKGITVCDEWSGRDGYEHFYNWAMSHGYNDDLTIDRIDSKGNYCPENCRWVTLAENVTFANKTSQHRKADNGTYYGISPDRGLYVFDNANAFSREHDLNANSVRRAAHHMRSRHKGWMFGYISELGHEPQSTIESIYGLRVEYISGEILGMEAPSTASL